MTLKNNDKPSTAQVIIYNPDSFLKNIEFVGSLWRVNISYGNEMRMHPLLAGLLLLFST